MADNKGWGMTNLGRFRGNPGTQIMAVLLAFLMVLGGCPALADRGPGRAALPPPASIPPPPLPGGPDSATLSPPVLPPAPNASRTQQVEEDPEGPVFTLTHGSPEGAKVPPIKTASLKPITREQYDRLVARLDPIKTNSEESFKLPTESLQPLPARPGTVKAVVFPPPASSQQPPKAQSRPVSPLRVTRFAPEGNVSEVTTVSVTFSQPMVAVTSADKAAETVPVKLSPQPEGQWRWLGTQTLVFEPKGKSFPRSSEFKVLVPKDIASQEGGKLAADITYKFRTPLIGVYSFEPQSTGTELKPELVATFTQKIDPAKVIKHMVLTSGKTTYAITLIPKADLLKQARFKDIEKNNPNRWLAAKPVSELPKDTKFSVTFTKGMPSEEGPLTPAQPTVYKFQTYGRFVIDRQNTHTDLDEWQEPYVCFSNSLATQKLLSKVQISPSVKDFKVNPDWTTVYLRGRYKSNTTYKVTFDPSIKDVYGQSLSGNPVVVFHTGEPSPSITAETFTVLQPASNVSYAIKTRGIKKLRVNVYKVAPADCIPIIKDDEGALKKLSPKRVWTGVVPVTAAADGNEDVTQFDIARFLPKGHGLLVLEVSDPASKDETQEFVVQVSDIGLEAFNDQMAAVVRASSMKSGTPLKDIELTFDTFAVKTKTDANGVATLQLPEKPAHLLIARRGEELAIVSKDVYNGEWLASSYADDICWFTQTDRDLYRPGETMHVKGWLRERNEGPKSTLKLLQIPNPKVRLKVLDASNNQVMEELHDIDKLGGFDFQATLPKNANLGSGRMEFALLRADSTEASNYERSSYSASFKIEEFRRPEFELSLTEDQTAPYFDGDQFSFTSQAKYFTGGPLSGAPLDWEVTTNSASYDPPGWSGFQFGEQPQWFSCFLSWTSVLPNSEGRKTLAATTDAAGKNIALVKVKKFVKHFPYTFKVSSTVTDVNRQSWTDTKSVLVHPGRLYVGVKQERRFVQAGEPIELKYIVSDIDGKATPKRVKFLIEREETTENDKGESETKTVKVATKELDSTEQPSAFEIGDTKAGLYNVIASVVDEKGRVSDTKLSVWVAGDSQSQLGGTNVEQGEVQVVGDRDTYSITDKARIMVIPPFHPCVGLITLRNHRAIIATKSFKCDKAFAMVELPLDEQCVPNFKVHVDVIGKQNSLTPSVTKSGTVKMVKRELPAFANGYTELFVPPDHHELKVAVTPAKSGIEPGGETDVDIDLKDSSDKPIEGQVAIAAVDESVLALAGYKQQSPIDTFYAAGEGDTIDSVYLMRSLSVPAVVEEEKKSKNGGIVPRVPSPAPSPSPAGGGARQDLAALPPPSSLPPPPLPGAPDGGLPALPGGGGGAGADGGSKPIKVRSDFNPLALFKEVAQTDEKGHVRIKVKVPDSLTRYRVMVWAVSGVEKAGTGDSNVTARLPLMVRPSLPRFLNCGDRPELPVVLQNQTDEPLEAEVAIRSNGLKLPEIPGGAVTVPANDRVEVRFPSETISAGTATIQLAAASGSFADAADANLPVYTPATTEAFATYGQLDQGMAVQSIETPAAVFTEVGSLDVTTCSTALGGLEDAYFSLRRYPFDCSEQVSSRLLSMLALKDVLSAFGKQTQESAAQTKAFMEDDIKLLLTRQKYNGGFGLWRSDETKEWPYVSCQVARALFLAKEKGFDVSQVVLNNCTRYLKDIERHVPLKTNSATEMTYSPKTRRAMLAYAQYVLALNKQAQVSESRKLLEETLKSMEAPASEKDQIGWLCYSTTTGTAETLAWLLPILTNDAQSKPLVESARRKIDSCISETAAGAEVVSDAYDSDAYLIFHSPRRSSAVVLESLMQDHPENPIIPKLVNHLMAVREKGQWNGTQENYYILCALDRYFGKYEKERPDFRVNMWIGSDFAGNQKFQGRSSDSNELKIPMSFLATRPQKEDLTIQKDGPGRLYYRIGMKFAPKNLMLDSRDRGFGVERKYIAVDNKDDVKVDKDGVIHVKSGATVKVTLSVNNAASRHHVALVDPIPAGFEIMNPALQGTREQPVKAAGESEEETQARPFWFWWDRYWYDHHNFRDDRVEVFSSLVWGGNRTYSYFARATTPGLYIVPPTKAEEMYAPETFGRASSLRVVVE